MCQWKFLVFRYRANTSARMAFMAPAMSLVAERVRSVGVASGASRLCRSSAVFVELFLLILFFPFSGFVFVWFGASWAIFSESAFCDSTFHCLLMLRFQLVGSDENNAPSPSARVG